jgi:hypothetical protein
LIERACAFFPPFGCACLPGREPQASLTAVHKTGTMVR